MGPREPFQPDDLAELDERLLAQAEGVIPLRLYEGRYSHPSLASKMILLRHDVDDHGFEPALAIAAWEAARNYHSTYFILHTAPYWSNERALREGLEHIALLGHEIGIHTNAIAEALTTGRDPDEILHEAIEKLRRWGFVIHGVAGHGDPRCYGKNGVEFTNDEHFIECARPEFGEPDRLIRRGKRRLKLAPRPLEFFGLTYEALRLPRSLYLSDSGGRWSPPFESVVADFPVDTGPLQFLWHPDWWHEAVTDWWHDTVVI